MGDQRREGLHHQLRHGHHRVRHRHGSHRPGRDQHDHRAVGHRRASRCSRPTGRWAGTRPTPTASPSPMPACPRPTCSASAAAGSRSSSQILDEGRIAISALAVGCVQACLEHCTRYAQDRHAFGRPIGANQGVAFQVADLAVMAETARLLTYQAAWLHDTGRPSKQAAAMAKLHTTEAAVTRHAHRHPDLRRLRVHGRDARRPLLPRRQDPRDRRGHQRGPTPRDQPRAGSARSSDPVERSGASASGRRTWRRALAPRVQRRARVALLLTAVGLGLRVLEVLEAARASTLGSVLTDDRRTTTARRTSSSSASTAPPTSTRTTRPAPAAANVGGLRSDT